MVSWFCRSQALGVSDDLWNIVHGSVSEIWNWCEGVELLAVLICLTRLTIILLISSGQCS